MKATVGCNYGLPMWWLSSKAYMFAVFLMLIASEFGSCDVSLAAVSNPALPVPADRSSYKATVKSASKTASGKHNAISPEVIDVGRPSGSVSVVDDTYIETSSRNSSTSAPSALAGMNSTVSLPKSKPITNVTLTANVSSESVNVRSQSRPRTKATEGYSRTRKLPEAIIIGVKKGGTRALLEFLKIHPDIRAPGPEIHFFDRYYDKGLDWYRSRMPPTLPGQLTVEKTPSYFVTRSAPLRVRRSMPADVRLVVVVRDPVTRALSDYTQALVKRPDLLPFERMAFSDPPPILQQHQQLPPPPFAADDASISSSTPLATTNSSTDFHESRVNTSWGAVRIGLYARHLERWLRWFPRNRFHFVNGERLIDDPAGEIGRLEDFLGVQRVVTADHFYFNATKGFPCLKKSEARAVPRCLGQAKGRAHPSVDPSAIERLRRFFRPHNRRFYAMTGIDFGWT